MKIRVTLSALGTVRPYFACAIVGNGKTEVMLLPTEGEHLPWLSRKNYPNGASDSQDLELNLSLAHSYGITHVAAFVVNEEGSPCKYAVENTYVRVEAGKASDGSEFTDLGRRVHQGCTPVVRACTSDNDHASQRGTIYSDLTSAVADFEQSLK